MGNHVSSSNDTVKVILLNGTVHEFQNPVMAAELMLDHPQQVVVQLQVNHQLLPRRPAPLPADKNLDAKSVYVMFPMRRGKPAALTSEESRRVLQTANKLLRSRKLLLSMPLPVLAKMCESTVDEGQKRIVVKQPEMSEEGLPEYLSRQVSGNKGWKPCLDTIKERKLEQKLSHWLFRL